MPRVFYPEPLSEGELLTLEGGWGHHFARVLRVHPGEEIPIVAAGVPRSTVVTAVDPARGRVEVHVGAALPRRDPRAAIYVVQGLPKGDKMETIIQKCTEIGAAGIQVAACERSVARISQERARGKLERWQRIAEEAASQAQRDMVPPVEYSPDWPAVEAWLRRISPHTILVCDEAETAVSLQDVVATNASRDGARWVVAIGPEGGWTEEERERWRTVGAVPISLGSRILRTETAGLVALSALLYALGDLAHSSAAKGNMT